VLLKTFVTSPMQDAIAAKFGVFASTPSPASSGSAPSSPNTRPPCRPTSSPNTAICLPPNPAPPASQHSKFLVFGGEESYGYMGDDFSRDKDGNGAVVMFAELAAYAASQGLTVAGLLDEVYCDVGYFLEVNQSKVFEGASGAAKIAKLADSYGAQPTRRGRWQRRHATCATSASPASSMKKAKPSPPRKCSSSTSPTAAASPSAPRGTEPKIKYYMFARQVPAVGQRLTKDELAAAKTKVSASLESLWTFLENDIDVRLA
jgi:phosphoglucomutase